MSCSRSYRIASQACRLPSRSRNSDKGHERFRPRQSWPRRCRRDGCGSRRSHRARMRSVVRAGAPGATSRHPSVASIVEGADYRLPHDPAATLSRSIRKAWRSPAAARSILTTWCFSGRASRKPRSTAAGFARRPKIADRPRCWRCQVSASFFIVQRRRTRKRWRDVLRMLRLAFPKRRPTTC